MPTRPDSRYLAFIDECGDHSLSRTDPGFPLFVLSTVLVEQTHYTDTVIPALARLKLSFWEHEGINLHSRDIRRGSGDFALMQVPSARDAMYSAINRLMSLDYTLFITAIRKDRLRDLGRHGENPYDIALSETMDGIADFIETRGPARLSIVAESRGTKEDADLAATFARLAGACTPAGAEPHRLVFGKKGDNIAGLQMADLAAYPYARWLLRQNRPDPSLEILGPHLYSSGSHSGLRILP